MTNNSNSLPFFEDKYRLSNENHYQIKSLEFFPQELSLLRLSDKTNKTNGYDLKSVIFFEKSCDKVVKTFRYQKAYYTDYTTPH